jgi:hypothetical protein
MENKMIGKLPYINKVKYEGMTPVLEHLCSMNKALSSNPCTTKINK